VQGTDVAGGVTVARRALISEEWREVLSENLGIQTQFLLSPETAEESLYSVQPNAQSEADRRQTLRGQRADLFDVVIQLNDDTETLDLGDVVGLTHSRYGLALGRKFRILRVEPNPEQGILGLRLWGPFVPFGAIAVAPTLAGSGTVT
jgi:hypothetical protein